MSHRLSRHLRVVGRFHFCKVRVNFFFSAAGHEVTSRPAMSHRLSRHLSTVGRFRFCKVRVRFFFFFLCSLIRLDVACAAGHLSHLLSGPQRLSQLPFTFICSSIYFSYHTPSLFFSPFYPLSLYLPFWICLFLTPSPPPPGALERSKFQVEVGMGARAPGHSGRVLVS